MNKFWVGNGGDITDSAHWANSTGGAGGAGAPSAGDSAKFDANSFTLAGQIVMVDDDTFECLDFNWTGAVNAPELNFDSSGGDAIITIHGNLILVIGMTVTKTGTDHGISLNSASGGFNIDTKGIDIPVEIGINNSSSPSTSTYDFLTNFSGFGFNVSDGITVDTNNVNFTFNFTGLGLNGGVINAGSSVFTFQDCNFNINDVVGVATFNAGTSIMNFTGVIASHISMQDQTLNTITIAGTAFEITVVGGTITNLTIGLGLTITWKDTGFSANPTITNFIVNGTSGNHVTFLSSDPGVTQAQITATNPPTINYCDPTDIEALGSIPFQSFGGVDGGNNTNWTFPAATTTSTSSSSSTSTTTTSTSSSSSTSTTTTSSSTSSTTTSTSTTTTSSSTSSTTTQTSTSTTTTSTSTTTTSTSITTTSTSSSTSTTTTSTSSSTSTTSTSTSTTTTSPYKLYVDSADVLQMSVEFVK